MSDFLLVAHARGPVHAARSNSLRAQAARNGATLVDLTDRIWLASWGPGEMGPVTAGGWRLIGQAINREHRTVDSAMDDDPWSYERKLVSRFWGRFVGVLIGGDGDLKAVLRDPCGGLDCVVWEDEGLIFVGSALPEWLAPPADWSLDWDRVLQALHDPLLVWDPLLLRGPIAVRPGTIQPLPLSSEPEELWNPAAVARRGLSRPLTDDQAAQALEQAIDDAVRGLARDAGPIAAEVSGGLDSSIVAAALVRVRADVHPWLNLHGSEAQSDERPFVAALAAKLGIDPLYVEHASGPLDEAGFAAISTGVRPGLGAMDFHHDVDWGRRLRDAGARAVITGRGGDSVLIQGATGEVFADLWRTHGWRAMLSPDLVGLARLNERSVWTLIAEARRRTPGRSPRQSALFRRADIPTPFWLQDCDDLGPAKTQQIAGLIDGIGRQSPSLQTRSVVVMTPLLSLPVVETCLALPAVQLVTGARERGLARRAFRDRLPAQIVGRRTKGEMSAIYGQMIARNLDRLRPFLLEGRLAAAGLIEREAMDAALTHDSLIWQGTYGTIMSAAAIEGWVRCWEDRLKARQPAASPGSPPASV